MRYSLIWNMATIAILLFLLSSCASRRDVIYFQENRQVLDSTLSVEYVRIKPMDMLRINVSGPDEEAIAPFMIKNTQSVGGGANNIIMYTVGEDGTITLPYLGAVPVAGKTRLEAITLIRESLKRYVNEPIVDVRIENFRVTILGQTRPQVIDFSEYDRPTVLDAIAMAGDLMMTAKRNDILVVREEGGMRQSYRLDIRDADIMNSPAYYLAQNDIIYIEPNMTGIQANRSTWYLSLGMTVLGLGLTIINLIN